MCTFVCSHEQGEMHTQVALLFLSLSVCVCVCVCVQGVHVVVATPPALMEVYSGTDRK